MYIARLVNIQDHTPWFSTWSSFADLLRQYGQAIYQQRQWQMEVWFIEGEEVEVNGNHGIIVTMQNGRWRMTRRGESHFTNIDVWPTFPEDRR